MEEAEGTLLSTDKPFSSGGGRGLQVGQSQTAFTSEWLADVQQERAKSQRRLSTLVWVWSSSEWVVFGAALGKQASPTGLVPPSGLNKVFFPP